MLVLSDSHSSSPSLLNLKIQLKTLGDIYGSMLAGLLLSVTHPILIFDNNSKNLPFHWFRVLFSSARII